MRLMIHAFVTPGVVSTVIIWLRVGVMFGPYSSLVGIFFSARLCDIFCVGVGTGTSSVSLAMAINSIIVV